MEKDNRVFVSYSRADRDRVMEIVRVLERGTGMSFWMDLTGIESGSQFEETIMKAIDRSDVVLFMMSDSFVSSPWTKREVYYAEDEGKKIVPVSVDGKPVRGWVKFHFGHIDCIDSQSPEQMEKLVADLKSWLGGAAPVNMPHAVEVTRPSAHKKRRWLIPTCIGIVAVLLALAFLVFRKDYSKSEQNPLDYAIEQQANEILEAVTSTMATGEHRGTANGHEWVDLGTGVKWASANVGASFAGGYGSYFAWGETEPKSVYSWDNYRYSKDGRRNTLDSSDDVAHKAWGGDWRTPTRTEFEALLSACSVAWTNKNGHDGCLFTSRVNGESIFLPASGCRMADSLSFVGRYGFYWSSSLNEDQPDVAWYLFFDQDGARMGDRYRYAGRTIRPVRP